MNGYSGQPVFRPGVGRPKSFDALVQDIASAAHGRGVVLMKGDTVVGSLEAAELCEGLRAAHENTRGEPVKHGHVERMTSGIALRLGARGSVQVSRGAWNMISGYARAIRTRGGSKDAPSRGRS